MKTAIATEDESFDINRVPIYAIAKLRAIMGIAGAHIMSFDVWGPTIGKAHANGMVRVEIENEGVYWGIIQKSDLNDSTVPALYAEYNGTTFSSNPPF